MNIPAPHSATPDETQFRHTEPPTDFFVTKGYRKLALGMLAVHIRDAISETQPEHAQAIAWIRYSPERGKLPGKGLAFDECVEYSGLRVRLDYFREKCLSAPKEAKEMLRLVESKLLSLCAEERSYLVPPCETRVGLGEIGHGRNNWLFGEAMPTASDALPAAQP